MSYNGSGTFNINSTGQPVVTGTAISSTVFNAFTADIGTGLSTALTKDGQTVATARIPFAAGINSSLVTDATNTTTGSIITAGGVGVAKALFVGTTANIAGTTTLAGVTATSITDSGLTSGRVTFASTAGLLADAAALAWDGTSLSATKFAGALNGTVGATTPSTGAFTTGTFSSTLGVTGITTVAAGTELLPAIVSTTGTADTGLWFPAAGDTIAASTSGVERLRIDSGGKVGIGLGASYNLPLSVVGDGNGQNIQLNGRTGDSLVQMFFRTFGGGNNLASISSESNGSLYFGTGSQTAPTVPTERMRILSTGEVGIGTNSPGVNLDVLGTSGVRIKYGAGLGLLISQASSGGSVAINNQANAALIFATNNTNQVYLTAAGRVGIGTGATVNYALEVSTDSAGKPGVGGLWTVVSDERIKSDIVPANLDRCYEIVKSVPLKYFGFAPGVYTDDQIQDKHNLGWIAQDVQKVFKNAVSVKPFTLKTDIPDGTEEYEEQDFTLEVVEKTETSIQVINGKAVQVSKVVKSDNKILLFDTVDVVDEAGAAVLEEYEVTPAVPAVAATDEIEAVEAIPAVMGTRPVTYQMPRMITKTRPKVRHNVIEDCLDLNSGQMLAALYGAVQALMAKIEKLENL